MKVITWIQNSDNVGIYRLDHQLNVIIEIGNLTEFLGLTTNFFDFDQGNLSERWFTYLQNKAVESCRWSSIKFYTCLYNMSLADFELQLHLFKIHGYWFKCLAELQTFCKVMMQVRLAKPWYFTGELFGYSLHLF